MTHIKLGLAAAVLAPCVLAPLGARGQIYMTSTLSVNGTKGAATCSTNAVNPAFKNVTLSPFAVSGDQYEGFSAVCILTGHGPSGDIQPLDSRDQPDLLPSSYAGYGNNYSNGYCLSKFATYSTPFGSYSGTTIPGGCSFNFPIIPGYTYTLTTQHYIWLSSALGNGSSAPPDPPDQYGLACAYGSWDDPQGFYASVQAAKGNNYQSQGLTETKTFTPSGVAACVSQASMLGDVIVPGDPSNAPYGFLVGTTMATMAAIEIDPPAAEFFQTQQFQFTSNPGDLQSVPGQTNDTLTWCIQDTAAQCGPAGKTEGSLAAGAQALTQTTSGDQNSVTLYAPSPIKGNPAGAAAPSTDEYLCVQDGLQASNYACAAVTLDQLILNVLPAEKSSAPQMLPANEPADFPISLYIGSTQRPAVDLTNPGLQNYMDTPPLLFTLTGPASTCASGFSATWDQVSLTGNYRYCAPPSQYGPGNLTATAQVSMPDGNTITLSGANYFNVVEKSSVQTINFPNIPTQAVGSTYSLSATSTSGLPVSYWSSNPWVASVNGSTLTMISPGNATITAQQAGNSTYAFAAPVSQSLTVALASQSINFPSIPAQSLNSAAILTATASSGLAVSYTSNTPSICTVNGPTAVPIAVGTCTITAQQAGNATYGAATATQSFLVAAGQAAAPTFSPGPGTYNSIPTITIGSSSPGTSIYFTHDGTTPTTASAQFTAPFQVKNSFTYQAIATGGLYTTSAVTSATYTLVALPPVFNPPAGTYPGPLTLTLTSASPNTDIFYLIGSGQAGASSTLYKTPITVASSETINAVTAQTGWTPSANITQAYTIEPYAAAPTFSLATGSYATAQTVVIADSTAGASIYYTTDGSTPTTSSSLYTGPIAVTASETLTAIAAASGYSNSPATAASYTIQ